MRHHLNHISMLAEENDMEALKTYLAQTVSRIPDLDMRFCENRAADSVLGYYCALAKREGIPFSAQIDLPQTLPVDEIDMCLVLSNLLENALEASLRTVPARRWMKVNAYVHAERLLLMQVENACDGEIKETNGIFRSSKRKGNGIGIQSVQAYCGRKTEEQAPLPIRTASLRKNHAPRIGKVPCAMLADGKELFFSRCELIIGIIPKQKKERRR